LHHWLKATTIRPAVPHAANLPIQIPASPAGGKVDFEWGLEHMSTVKSKPQKWKSGFASEKLFDGRLFALGAQQIKFVALNPGGGDEPVDFGDLWGGSGVNIFHRSPVNDEQPEVARGAWCQRLAGAETDHRDFHSLPVFNRAT